MRGQTTTSRQTWPQILGQLDATGTGSDLPQQQVQRSSAVQSRPCTAPSATLCLRAGIKGHLQHPRLSPVRLEAAGQKAPSGRLFCSQPDLWKAPEISHLLGEGKACRGELGEQSLPAAPYLGWGHRRAGATLGEPPHSPPGPAAPQPTRPLSHPGLTAHPALSPPDPQPTRPTAHPARSRPRCPAGQHHRASGTAGTRRLSRPPQGTEWPLEPPGFGQ